MSDEADACTKGIWFHPLDLGKETVIFADVEGTNLGDDKATDQLSAFVRLLSSYRFVFTEKKLTNSLLGFMDKMHLISDDFNISMFQLSKQIPYHIVIRNPMKIAQTI